MTGDAHGSTDVKPKQVMRWRHGKAARLRSDVTSVNELNHTPKDAAPGTVRKCALEARSRDQRSHARSTSSRSVPEKTPS
jgi:hypothetical protein